MGVLAHFDGFMARVKANERLHLAWCCTGVIGCLVAYGVLQVRSALLGVHEGGGTTATEGQCIRAPLQLSTSLN